MHVIWVLESLECFVSLIWFDIISYQHLLPFVAWHDFAVPAAGCWPRPSWHLDSWSNWGWRTVLFCVGNDSSPSKLRWNLKMIPLKRKIIWWNLHFWVPSYFSGVYQKGIMCTLVICIVLQLVRDLYPCHTDCVICSRILPAIPQASPHLRESTRITCNIHNSQCIYHINIMCLNMYTIHEHTHTPYTL